MDIADTSRWLLERALKTYDDSDDFVNLEVKSTHQAESVSAPNDSILTALVNDETSYTDAATRPFLTQSAEVELYLLATNFLVSYSCASLCPPVFLRSVFILTFLLIESFSNTTIFFTRSQNSSMLPWSLLPPLLQKFTFRIR